MAPTEIVLPQTWGNFPGILIGVKFLTTNFLGVKSGDFGVSEGVMSGIGSCFQYEQVNFET
jgi:hypothetical protein